MQPVNDDRTSTWISVSERLPDDGDRSAVIALRANEPDEDLRLIVSEADHVRANPEDFTHWMPTPPLP